MNWPNNADGDVFRRLVAHGFDFEREHAIWFFVDFTKWPPSKEVAIALNDRFGDLRLYPPNGGSHGYIKFSVRACVDYDLVMQVQDQATKIAHSHGGVCESWEVLQEPS